jgi:hypothetical protein
VPDEPTVPIDTQRDAGTDAPPDPLSRWLGALWWYYAEGNPEQGRRVDPIVTPETDHRATVTVPAPTTDIVWTLDTSTIESFEDSPVVAFIETVGEGAYLSGVEMATVRVFPRGESLPDDYPTVEDETGEWVLGPDDLPVEDDPPTDDEDRFTPSYWRNPFTPLLLAALFAVPALMAISYLQRLPDPSSTQQTVAVLSVLLFWGAVGVVHWGVWNRE